VETLTARDTGDTRLPQATAQDYRKPDRISLDVELASRVLPSSEVEELKKVLLRSLEKTGVSGKESAGRQREKSHGETGTQEVAALAEELRANGVEESAITQLLIPVAAAAARGETPDRLREELVKTVTAGINCSGAFKVKKNAPRILALVGPTGVGKTTTIAKLAALAYKQGISVALITIDTFRIGAVAQLSTYSGIMDMPMAIASTPDDLAKAIDAHADKQLIFIDTAGRNPQDQRIQEMKAFLEVNPAIETHLCLSATTRDKELTQAVSRFGVLPISSMLFTKLDESMSFGCIVNTHLRTKMPLSYFTTGQRVPEDIETATPQRVADLVVREMKP
jgi:flagellar biosynthesis protein FlhF